MRNYLYIFVAILFTLMISSCSKKIVSNPNIERNREYSQRLEANYPTFAGDVVDAENKEINVEASAGVSISNLEKPQTDARFETSKPLAIKHSKIVVRENAKAEKVRIFSSKILKVVDAEKLGLRIEKQKNEEVSGGQLITGIIIGAIGLGLIAIAGATGAVALVYVAGVVLFVAGVLLILIGIF
ncbi:MAG: hypothetical protein ACKVOU_00515 [Cytophagales bacterium]